MIGIQNTNTLKQRTEATAGMNSKGMRIFLMTAFYIFLITAHIALYFDRLLIFFILTAMSMSIYFQLEKKPEWFKRKGNITE